MENKKNGSQRIYVTLIVIFIIVYFATLILFSLMETEQALTEEGYFITPGDYNQEWLIAILPVPILIFITGLVSIFLFFNIGIKFYIRMKKETIGLIPLPEEQREIKTGKILARAVILCFFFANLSSIMASSEIIVEFMRSVYPLGNTEMSPDPEVMWQLVWIFSIPTTLIIVPFWILQDTGLGIIKKDKQTGMESVVLVGERIYSGIQGYAGIGFILQLFFSIFILVAGSYWDPEEAVGMGLMIISPIIAICFALPFVVYIDRNMEKYRGKLVAQLRKSDISQTLVSKVEKI